MKINAILRLERKQRKIFKSSRIRTILFLFYLCGIETINTLIHSCSSLENHTRFQARPKWAKCIPCGTYLGQWLKGVSPPGTGAELLTNKLLNLFRVYLFIFKFINYLLFIHLFLSNQRIVA